MPYKHRNIQYDLPSDSFDQALYSEYQEDLMLALGLARQPVGVKLFFDDESYRSSPEAEMNGKLSYCLMIEKASGKGWAHKSRLANHICDGGTTALGLERSTEKIESGMEYFSYNLYRNPAVARRMRQNIKSLHSFLTQTYGIAVQPLKDFTYAPDVVVVICDPYQAMRIIQGYVYHSGNKPGVDIGAMQALCSEVTVSPYLSGEINISAMCPSTRMLCKWRDDEMAVGIPLEQFAAVVQGILATINATDNKKRKEAIIARFHAAGKELPLNLQDDYA